MAQMIRPSDGEAEMKDDKIKRDTRRQYLNRKARRKLAKRGKLFKDKTKRAWKIANERLKSGRRK